MSSEEEAQLHAAPNQTPREPVNKKRGLIISAVIILVGAIMVAVSAAMYAPFTAPAEYLEVAAAQQLGAVVDAGESETKLCVYGCTTDPCKKPFESCDDTCKSVKELKTVVCESRGLGNYSEAEVPQLKESIAKCLQEGAKGYDNDLVPVSYIVPEGKSEIFKNIESNFSNFQWLEEEGKDIKPVDVIKTSMNAKLYRPITEEVVFRAMTPAVPWLVILVIGVFVIVGGISYLHMVCDQAKLADE